MNDDFYASIKLVSGEELFAITSSENDTLIVQDPVCIETVHGPRGSFVRIEPWMHVPNDQFYFIDKAQIITMTEVECDHEMVEYYTNYIIDAAEDRMGVNTRSTGKVKPSEKMGYLGDVKSARKNLENLFKLEADPRAGIATHA